jgi:precorrin-6B C5,15-methyltransferase / cobalt-precorrin-6B C5,C15-methyltransferase
MINIIGIGLDGIEGLTPKLITKIKQSSILAGSDRLLNCFPDYQGKKIIFNDLTHNLTQIKDYYNQGNKITILATGDPLFFGIGRLLLQNFIPEKLAFYPHLSSIQLAFNKIKIPWHDSQIISLHGRNLESLIPLLKKGKDKIFILTDSRNNPPAIASLYLALNLPSSYYFYVAENLGSDQEQIYHFSTPTEIKKLSQQKTNFASLNVIILIRQGLKENDLNLTELPIIGIPDQNFLTFSDRPGLLTKREIRLNILGELALKPNQIIWDIGAGTGSVSIEIARLSPTSSVYAIEKTAMGISLIQQNSQRFQVSNVIPINGEAPAILKDLPTPEGIFIGGSGGNLTEILEFCSQKLAIDGILVIALTTLEHFYDSLNWFKCHQMDYNVLNLQISRSVPINNLTRLTPLNPINLISVKKTNIL